MRGIVVGELAGSEWDNFTTAPHSKTLEEVLAGRLGHLGVQYAARMGFHTVGIARGSDKEALARELGAAVYIDSQAQDVCLVVVGDTGHVGQRPFQDLLALGQVSGQHEPDGGWVNVLCSCG